MKYKIIEISNFNHEHIPDEIIADNLESEKDAELMADILNERYSGYHAMYFYKVVDETYVLHQVDY